MGTARTHQLDGLAPGFLVAMPQLQDPNFYRSVVLLMRSEEGGAFGLVINRETDLRAGELCREHEIALVAGGNQRVMVGGPVEQERHLLVLHGEDPIYAVDSEQELVIAPGIRLVTALEGLQALADREATRFRCYLGYSGWGPDQLEEELSQGAWVPLACDPSFLFDERPADVWSRALRRAGIDPLSLVPGGAVN
jgi:putative transcriptional regulator